MPKEFTPDEIELIKKQCFPTSGSAIEFQTCLAVARELGLNPILKEIHFMPRRQRQGDQWLTRVEPLVGRDGFLSIAHRSGQLAGMESSTAVRAAPRLITGQWESLPDLIAECRVWRKDAPQPFTVTVSFAEYVQKGNDSQPTRFWGEKPETMLKKVAESQCLRKAFNVHGVYAPEELGLGMETGGEIVSDPESAATVTNLSSGRKRSDPPMKRGETAPVGAVATKSVPAAPVSRTETMAASVHVPAADPLQPIMAACKAKGITVEQKGEILTARSYTHRDFLKVQGFRWDGQQRAWLYSVHADAA